MNQPLGKMEKPEAGSFTGKRKLYHVPLIFCSDEAPEDYREKYNRYWEEVSQHLDNLEIKTGPVRHIYHESITLPGEEGLKVVEKVNPPGYELAQARCQAGAILEATEDRELSAESLDWERCLIMGFASQQAYSTAAELYATAAKKRYQHIALKIDETLKADEAGILFIREGHLVQFPEDVEVFSVSPPTLDDIHRWQRERLAQQQKQA